LTACKHEHSGAGARRCRGRRRLIYSRAVRAPVALCKVVGLLVARAQPADDHAVVAALRAFPHLRPAPARARAASPGPATCQACRAPYAQARHWRRHTAPAGSACACAQWVADQAPVKRCASRHSHLKAVQQTLGPWGATGSLPPWVLRNKAVALTALLYSLRPPHPRCQRSQGCVLPCDPGHSHSHLALLSPRRATGALPARGARAVRQPERVLALPLLLGKLKVVALALVAHARRRAGRAGHAQRLRLGLPGRRGHGRRQRARRQARRWREGGLQGRSTTCHWYVRR